jgi:hypothetical protein
MSILRIMHTAFECERKADEMEAIARTCTGPLAVEYRDLAADWRKLAKQVAQDEFGKQDGPPLH